MNTNEFQNAKRGQIIRSEKVWGVRKTRYGMMAVITIENKTYSLYTSANMAPAEVFTSRDRLASITENW